jgi:hypothetical protein
VVRLEENTIAGEIVLFDDDVKAIRKLVDEAEVVGDRYMKSLMVEINGDCIDLLSWKGYN